jgi:hypothetical protein
VPSAPDANVIEATSVSSTAILCSAVAAPRVHRRHVAEQVQQQVDRVDALVHEGAAAVERLRSAPRRVAVVLRSPIPLHPRIDEQDGAEAAAVDGRFRLGERRRAAILEEDTERDAGAFDGGDGRVDPLDRHVERLLAQDVTATGRRQRNLVGVDAGRTSYADDVERGLVEERGQGRRGHQAVPAGRRRDFLRVVTAHARGLGPGTPCTARMWVSVMLPPPVNPTRIVTSGLVVSSARNRPSI